MAISATLAINEEAARRHRAGQATVPLGFDQAGVPVHPGLVDATRCARSPSGTTC